MKAKPVFSFCFFLISFFAILTLRFQFFIIDNDSSNLPSYLIALASVLTVFFLARVVHGTAPEKSKFRAVVDATGIALVAFFAVSFCEQYLSDQQLLGRNKPENFSSVSGHCGIYSGRTILKILHLEAYDNSEGALKEFKLNQSCRLAHLGFIMQNQANVCNAKEDGIVCLTRWMGGIAEHGYWSRYTRKFFYDQVIKWWPQSKKEEALVDYAAKDQELETGRQSILKQAGIEETFDSKLLLVQEREELSNLMLTRDIFKTLELSLPETKSNPAPYVFKFRDLKLDAEQKLAKIPELEKEVAKLKN